MCGGFQQLALISDDLVNIGGTDIQKKMTKHIY
jgi:hypothetical protein